MTLFGVSLFTSQTTFIALADKNVTSENLIQSSKKTSGTNSGSDEVQSSSVSDSEPSSSSQETTESNSVTKPDKSVIKPKAGSAPDLISEFYVIKPKLTRYDHLVLDLNSTKQSLNLSMQTSLGNQLLGVEWRPESNAYIIYLSANKQVLLKPAGDTVGSKITSETQKNSVNNLSRFTDDYLWDIESFNGSYKIINRKNQLVLALKGTSNHVVGDELILEKWSAGENQEMLMTRFNGYYAIKSEGLSASGNNVIDINNGFGIGNDIMTSLNGNYASQKWFVLYSSDVNAYVLGNAFDKRILLSAENGPSKSPITSTFNPKASLAFKYRHILYSVKDSKNRENIYEIWGNPGYMFASEKKPSLPQLVTYESKIKGQPIGPMGLWELVQVGTIPPPNLTDFKLDKQGTNPIYYVGETINYSATVKTSDFRFVTAYFRTDSEHYKVMDLDLYVANGMVNFSSELDTLQMEKEENFEEGEHFIELLTKGDGLFNSNSLAARVKILYPTPTAKPIPKKVYLNSKLSQFKGEDFVKDIKDEVGNPIEVKLVSLDTSKVGETKAVVSLANQYKTIEIEVPVEIIKEPAKLKVDFVNEADTLLPGYSITLDGFVGDPIDLTKEQEVINQLLNIKRAGYKIVGRPENETAVAMNATSISVKYTLQGLITLTSAPKTLDFGTLTYDAKDKKVESPSFDQKLVVTDTRADASKGFSVTAALTKPLTNEKGQELEDVLSYVYQDEEKKLTAQEQEIYKNTEGVPGSYTISDSWKSKKEADGLKLKIKGTTMLHTGKYQGVITWKIMAGQP